MEKLKEDYISIDTRFASPSFTSCAPGQNKLDQAGSHIVQLICCLIIFLQITVHARVGAVNLRCIHCSSLTDPIRMLILKLNIEIPKQLRRIKGRTAHELLLSPCRFFPEVFPILRAGLCAFPLPLSTHIPEAASGTGSQEETDHWPAWEYRSYDIPACRFCFQIIHFHPPGYGRTSNFCFPSQWHFHHCLA